MKNSDDKRVWLEIYFRVLPVEYADSLKDASDKRPFSNSVDIESAVELAAQVADAALAKYHERSGNS